MKITEYTLKRPVTASMFFVALLVLGGISLYRAPLEFMPKADLPEVDIQIPYPASSPDEVQDRIVKPIEEALSVMSGIEKMYSRSSINGAYMHLTFKAGANVDFEVLDVRERIDQIRDDLPSDLDFIWIWKFDSESIPIFIIGIRAEQYDPDLNDLVDQRLAQVIKRVDGAANVEVWGMEKKRVLVEVDRDKLAEHGSSLLRIFQTITANNMDLDAGQVMARGKKYDLRVTGQAKSLEELRDLKIAPNIRLSDVAEVKFDYAFELVRGRIDRERAYILIVRKESGSNTVDVCRRVKKALDAAIEDPALVQRGIKLKVFFDQSGEITKAIDGLRSSGIQGGILAAIVIFIFLRNFRSTLIIAISIPASIVLAILSMDLLLDMSFNMISLSGLMLAIGMLVDNSIVVMEAIYSKMQKGMSAVKASYEGTKEVGLAISISTTTTLIVFLPLVFAAASESVVIMREFGLVLCLSISSSLFVALTVVPLLASVILNPHEKLDTPKWFDRLNEFYVKVLTFALTHRRKAIVAAFAMLLLTAIPIAFIEREFVPETAMRLVRVLVKLDKAKSIDDLDALIDKVEGVLWAHKDEWGLETMAAFFNRDFIEINLLMPELNPKMQRNEIKRRAQETLKRDANWPGVQFDLETMGFEGPASMGLTIRVLGDDPQILYKQAAAIKDRIAKIPELSNVRISAEDEREIDIHLDRARARVYDIDVTQAAYELAFGVRGTNAGWIQHQDKQTDIVIQLRKSDRETVTRLKTFPIANRQGDEIPLASFAVITEKPVARAIRRENRRTYVQIPVEYSQKDLFKLKKKISEALQGYSMPRGYSWSMGDQFDKVKDAFITLIEAIALAIVLVFIVMIGQFESFFLPFVIMFTMPFAIIGIYWALFVSGHTINVLSGAGVLMLAGVVVNNAIVLVDHIHNLRKQGMSEMDSLVQGSRDRFRPILMTAGTTIFGLVPMAMGASDQGRLIYSPLAVAVLGGMISSTLMTPILIPVIYSYSDGFLGRMIDRWKRLIGWAKKP